MMRFWIVMLVPFVACSQSALDLKNEALKNLKQFNPSAVIPQYNPHPLEEHIQPEMHDDQDYLKSLGYERLEKEDDARFVCENEASRVKIIAHEKDKIFQDAEKIIEHAEENIYPNCHDEPVPCDEKKTEHICHETSIYKPYFCDKILNIVLQKKQHPLLRRLIKPDLPIDLTQCVNNKSEYSCDSKKLIPLSPRCKHLSFHLRSLSGAEVEVLKYPSCQDPTFIFKGIDGKKGLRILDLDVQEIWEEEEWKQNLCDFLSQHFCVAKANEHCVDGIATKVIDGISVTRPCWKKTQEFSCAVDFNSDCNPWQEKGCSNTLATCTNSTNQTHCDEIERVYQCIERTCYPPRRICTQALPCVDGSCDKTQNEQSDDINEGVSRLGALAGTAEEVAKYQVQNHSPSIFKGEKFECEEYPIGLRDCCTNSGFLEGLIHCPKPLQELQKAMLEGRVASVGHYKDRFYETKKFVYCVFPSKLAGIVQIQGRWNQLGISFGEAKAPNCRGITPEELEHINFSALNLSAIVDELKGHIQFIDNQKLEDSNKNHIEELNQKGKAHD